MSAMCSHDSIDALLRGLAGEEQQAARKCGNALVRVLQTGAEDGDTDIACYLADKHLLTLLDVLKKPSAAISKAAADILMYVVVASSPSIQRSLAQHLEDLFKAAGQQVCPEAAGVIKAALHSVSGTAAGQQALAQHGMPSLLAALECDNCAALAAADVLQRLAATQVGQAAIRPHTITVLSAAMTSPIEEAVTDCISSAMAAVLAAESAHQQAQHVQEMLNAAMQQATAQADNAVRTVLFGLFGTQSGQHAFAQAVLPVLLATLKRAGPVAAVAADLLKQLSETAVGQAALWPYTGELLSAAACASCHTAAVEGVVDAVINTAAALSKTSELAHLVELLVTIEHNMGQTASEKAAVRTQQHLASLFIELLADPVGRLQLLLADPVGRLQLLQPETTSRLLELALSPLVSEPQLTTKVVEVAARHPVGQKQLMRPEVFTALLRKVSYVGATPDSGTQRILCGSLSTLLAEAARAGKISSEHVAELFSWFEGFVLWLKAPTQLQNDREASDVKSMHAGLVASCILELAASRLALLLIAKHYGDVLREAAPGCDKDVSQNYWQLIVDADKARLDEMRRQQLQVAGDQQNTTVALALAGKAYMSGVGGTSEGRLSSNSEHDTIVERQMLRAAVAAFNQSAARLISLMGRTEDLLHEVGRCKGMLWADDEQRLQAST